MVVYSINDLEKITGVKAHTLRIWEKRYGIIQPQRTHTNIRYYLDEDLKHVLNIAILNKNGMKISKIAKLGDDGIKRRVAELSEVNEEFENHLDSLTLSLLEMNEYKFEKILNKNFEQRGFREAMLNVVYPLINKLSMMWITESIMSVQENFVSYFIRQKIIAAIDKLPSAKDRIKPYFLIYLPKDENHELSMLFMHYIIKEAGFRVINLGVNIEVTDLIDAWRIVKPTHVFTLLSDTYSDSPVQNYVDILLKYMSNTTILLSGLQPAKQPVRSQPNLEVLTGFPEIISYMDKLKETCNTE